VLGQFRLRSASPSRGNRSRPRVAGPVGILHVASRRFISSVKRTFKLCQRGNPLSPGSSCSGKSTVPKLPWISGTAEKPALRYQGAARDATSSGVPTYIRC
jgi:hypothetical protein